MADDNDNRPKEQGRGQQNQVSERGNGGQQGGESHQSGHIDKGRQGGQKPDTRPTGDYGVAAGLAYDDQTTRQVYEEPSASRFEQAKQDVSKVFATPIELCNARDLSSEEKIYLLKQWDTDLRLLMVASEENMPGTNPGRTAELLQIVHQKLEELHAPKNESAAVNKAGG